MQNVSFSKLSIIIPLFNEEKTICKILDKIKGVSLIDNIAKEIIIVDDGSTDKSKEVLKQYQDENPNQVIILSDHTKNIGKGAAIQQGIKEVTGDLVIIQDADLEYDPKEYNTLLKPMVDGFADVVYGSRFKGSKSHRILFFLHSVGNIFLTFLSNMFTNLNLTDMETCYKLFKTDIIKSLKLKEKRFGFEPEVTAKVAKIPKIRIYEVGISYYGRDYEDGKKIGWKDGIRALICIIKYSF